MKISYEILIAVAWMLIGGVLMMNAACADDRFTTQGNFDQGAFYEQARFARVLEAKPDISKAKPMMEKVYAAKATHDGEEYVWIWEECEGSTKWCYWGERKTADFGAAEKGQAFDLATTAIGIAVGLAEGNPIGLALLPVKAGLIYQSRSVDFEQCVTWRAPTAAVGYGAGAGNMVSIASIIAGSFIGLPAALAITAIGAIASWDTEQAMYECAKFTLT